MGLRDLFVSVFDFLWRFVFCGVYFWLCACVFCLFWTGGLWLYWYGDCGFRLAAYIWMDGGMRAGGGKCLLVFGIGTDDGGGYDIGLCMMSVNVGGVILVY